MTESEVSASRPPCEVRILYMSEAEEWAVYLQKVLTSTRRFTKKSVVLHALPESTTLGGYEQELVRASGSIILLMSASLLDFLEEPNVLETYLKVFHQPNRMVLLFCGVSESEMPEECFQHWYSCRKLYADDNPAVYISTVLDAVSDVRVSEPERECDRAETEAETGPETGPEAGPETHTEESQPPEPPPETEPASQQVCLTGQGAQTHPTDPIQKTDLTVEPTPSVQQADLTVDPTVLVQEGDLSVHPPASVQEPGLAVEPTPLVQETCITVQPSRIQCGCQVNIFFILRCKMDAQARAEVEFSCQDSIPKREPGTVENEYTVSVKAPDMPPGTVLVSLFCNDSVVCSRPITYFTRMGEISSCLETETNPLSFLCQAFNITSNSTEALDKLLTDSLRSRIPSNGLHIFGVSQVEEENMSAYQRNEELPTLLHFAARFGLQKLAGLLLQCPGALQAYSVANKYGDYPNSLAEKQGFSSLRQLMDQYVETADMLNSHMKEEEDEEVYEPMTGPSHDVVMKYSLSPGSPEDIYEDMDQALRQSLNPEEALLRKFFQGKTEMRFTENEEDEEDRREEVEGERQEEEEEEEEGREGESIVSWEEEEEEEDPYNMCFPDQIYDTVDEHFGYIPELTNRPPAPIPRSSVTSQPEDNKTYISRVFHEKHTSHRTTLTPGGPYTVPARPVRDMLSPTTYDPYAGMRTQGQRQLISLQERVKVGDLNVDEAVREFKAWQMNQDMRAQSLRFQQENIKKLRDSITRRHREQGKTGKDIEITSPLPPGQWSERPLQVDCCVYETASRAMTLPPTPNPPARPVQRGSWQNGSSSSLSSDGSNRLSALSISSGADGDLEDSVDCPPLPPPPRGNPPPVLPPPRVPPRIPERIPENPLMDRYVASPSRSLPPTPQRAPSRPPLPRRTR